MSVKKETDDFAPDTTTIELLCYGYLRINGFFQYNIKLDDLIHIILNYVREFGVKIGKNSINIDTFFEHNNKSGDDMSIDVFDKKFLIATSYSREIDNHYLLSNLQYVDHFTLII